NPEPFSGQGIRNQIHEATDRIRLLSHSATQSGDVVLLITELVSLITDIADKTDILSNSLGDSVGEEEDSTRDLSLGESEIQKLAERSDLAVRQLSQLMNLVKRDKGDSKESETLELKEG
ncbi:MAG: hypothetical protein OEZ23_07455, partial [Gammaproteobacteria bacterium]|nr:hypothetical protein [Gammaproteobacteria bacterium]